MRAYAPKPGMLLHDEPRRRLAPMLGNDGRKLRLLHALLLSLPGSQVLYYGDEIGMGEDLSLPDRFGLRTPMRWPDARRLEGDPTSMLSWLKRALKIRRSHPVFARGSMDFLPGGGRSVLAFRRVLAGKELRVYANLSAASRRMGPLQDARGFRDLWDGGTFAGPAHATLSPYGFRWLIR